MDGKGVTDATIVCRAEWRWPNMAYADIFGDVDKTEGTILERVGGKFLGSSTEKRVKRQSTHISKVAEANARKYAATAAAMQKAAKAAAAEKMEGREGGSHNS